MTSDWQAHARAHAEAALRDLEEAGLVRRPPNLLDLTWHDVRHLAGQGYALFWLLGQLSHAWASRPDTPLVDVLKQVPRVRAAYLARELGVAGIHDLDELLLPDDAGIGE